MEKRDKRTEYDYDWDDSVYGTGRTQPPKSRGGLVALMLILVIFLCGVVTVLGILNVKLFRQLKDRQEQDLGMSFSNAQTIPVQTEPAVVEAPPMPASADPKATLDLHSAPAGVENIPSEGGLSLQEIYSRSIPSVVSIGCTLPGGSSNGTGVVLTENGYLVTNAHVVEGAVSISVRLSDEREFTARIIGSDEVSDLAVLRIGVEGLTPAQFGDSANLRVGDSVVAIGDPLGVEYRGTYTNGIISGIDRDVDMDGRTMTLIQTNAALNSGNSGGPLINCYGQVIGINTMKLRSYYSTTAEGLGFAIPMAVAKPILEELMENGYVAGRPAIGISYDTLPLAFRIYYNLPEGVYISAVYDGSDAQAKGVAAGDIITAVNGTRVTSIDELNRVKNQFTAGDSITLTLYNGGSYRDVEVTLIDQATGQ